MEFIKFTLNPEAPPLPASVFLEVLDALRLMAEGVGVTGQEQADSFEASRITIGFSEQEAQDIYAYHTESDIWDVPEGAVPVAQWDSGLSVGCSSTLYLEPNGEFYWTEP